jgi:hypothetical protein
MTEETDTEDRGTPEEPVIARAAIVRAYIPEPGIVILRRHGQEFERHDIRNCTFDELLRLACEGLILAYRPGVTLLAMLSGAALPDRTPPKEKITKGPAGKPLDPQKTEAIAAVMAEELYAIAKFRHVGRLAPPENKAMRVAADEEAMARTLAMTPEVRRKALQKPSVAAKLAELRGVSTLLGDLEAVSDSLAEDVAKELRNELDAAAD